VRLLPYFLALAVLSLASPAVLAQSPPAGRTVEGKAKIVDGDTLEIGIRRVHLYGIDAPEPDQTCERAGRTWRCGMEATYAMAALLEFHWLVCRQQEIDPAGDMVGVCRIGGPKGFSVNREIVRRGWALALRQSGDDYAAAGQEAKAAKVGLWSGTFVAPWEWRRTHETGKTTN
jgi:endonuclease YncB( thermonuclease family)